MFIVVKVTASPILAPPTSKLICYEIPHNHPDNHLRGSNTHLVCHPLISFNKIAFWCKYHHLPTGIGFTS